MHEHLKSKGLSAELYAFPSIMTFSAGVPPLQEALRLWDFLLAFGMHLNVLCVVAQLHLMKSDLLAEARYAVVHCTRGPSLKMLHMQSNEAASKLSSARCLRDYSNMSTVHKRPAI